MSQESALVGVIGGTGVYHVDGLTDIVELDVTTPFGNPSSKIVLGNLGSVRIAFIARHDRTHRLLPSEIPFKANIYAFKSIGVKYILSFTAVGSLKETIRPGDVCLADQYYDNTKHRGANNSFFGNGIIAHVTMADPVCHILAGIVQQSVASIAATIEDTLVHVGGTYVCIEGPCFSTKAESNVYRSWGASVIGMTGMPEAKLAREAEIAYTPVCLVTDYDCWHPEHANVTVEVVMNTLKKNGNLAQRVVKDFAERLGALPQLPVSPAHTALNNSIMTHSEHITKELRDSIGLIINKYV